MSPPDLFSAAACTAQSVSIAQERNAPLAYAASSLGHESAVAQDVRHLCAQSQLAGVANAAELCPGAVYAYPCCGTPLQHLAQLEFTYCSLLVNVVRPTASRLPGTVDAKQPAGLGAQTLELCARVQIVHYGRKFSVNVKEPAGLLTATPTSLQALPARSGAASTLARSASSFGARVLSSARQGLSLTNWRVVSQAAWQLLDKVSSMAGCLSTLLFSIGSYSRSRYVCSDDWDVSASTRTLSLSSIQLHTTKYDVNAASMLRRSALPW